jgi:hypothetical protein
MADRFMYQAKFEILESLSVSNKKYIYEKLSYSSRYIANNIQSPTNNTPLFYCALQNLLSKLVTTHNVITISFLSSTSSQGYILYNIYSSSIFNSFDQIINKIDFSLHYLLYTEWFIFLQFILVVDYSTSTISLAVRCCSNIGVRRSLRMNGMPSC